MDDVVTITQAAEVAGVHKNTIRQWIKTGKIIAAKVKTDRGETYMIPREALEAIQHGDSDPPGTELVISAPTVNLSPHVESVVQRVVSPFLGEFQTAYVELGAARERIKHLEAQIEEMKALPATSGATELIASKDDMIATLTRSLEEKEQAIVAARADQERLHQLELEVATLKAPPAEDPLIKVRELTNRLEQLQKELATPTTLPVVSEQPSFWRRLFGLGQPVDSQA